MVPVGHPCGVVFAAARLRLTLAAWTASSSLCRFSTAGSQFAPLYLQLNHAVFRRENFLHTKWRNIFRY
jgi:hypothetical protein